MSSSQNNAQSRKVSSIARRLNRRVFVKKNVVAFWCDLFLIFVGLFIFFLGGELASNNNSFYQASYRNLHPNREVKSELNETKPGYGKLTDYIAANVEKINYLLVYEVRDGEGIVLYRAPALWAVVGALGFLLALHLLQVVWHVIELAHEHRRIKDILTPISEIAVKADELSKLEFDESKYHLLEEKITSLSPEESLTISHGDKDLESIETAINNLLLRMRESNMRQARFVNDASHELRTPIAVIEGYSNMLARWGREDEKVLDESINAIQHESAHMKYLVEQLLFLARGDSGKTVLHLEQTSLNDMMREIYEESLMIDENHIYRFSAPEETILAECDAALLKQAVRILVDNAAKYTREHDEICIGLGKTETGRPYVQVQDSGIGMAEADVLHMFERFYRADDARSYKGTGLGLSIAKWIVDKHRGHFEVVSRTELGTRIRIVL